ncbi:MAG TPA: N-acetylmuramoyl-L-alanine amidase [Patescibacteria group bacterium]|nr:N-acetylmuramoyl-L-alanine amidase [Patescibacteria group bacterium]
MKIRKLFIFLYGTALMIFFFSGCATTPVRSSLPAYSLNGTTYLPLSILCTQKGFSWDYDTFTRTATLTRGAHKISLKPGDAFVLVDGQLQQLSHPVDLYQGAIVVPYKFSEQVLDPFAREAFAPTHAPLALYGIKKIVVDAGHGGNDPGAIGHSGLREKDINLDIAKRLAKLLKDEGFEVVLTRSGDRFIELSQRVEIANDSKADLFVSVHTNASRVRSLKGFEIYYVSPYTSDTKRAASAAKDGLLKFGPACFADSSADVKAVLWDMIYTSSRAESIELARAISRAVDSEMDVKVLGVKSANFFVLKGARMPAVLAEIGFITNHNEEQLLKNGYYRQQIADAIYRGITGYARDYTIVVKAQNNMKAETNQ